MSDTIAATGRLSASMAGPDHWRPMAAALPEPLAGLLDRPVFVHLATLRADGSPHVSAMWVLRDGDRLVFNTAEGRVKWHNIQRDRRVAVSVSDPDDDYVNWVVEGRVVDIRTSDGVAVIDAMARKYTDEDRYIWLSEGMVRVTFIVEVDRAVSNR